jgi:hypothetical protein
MEYSKELKKIRLEIEIVAGDLEPLQDRSNR